MRLKLHAAMVLVFVLFWGAPSLLRASALSQVEEEQVDLAVAARQKNTQTLSMQVEQTVRMADLAKPIASKGKLSYRRGALRIDFTEPAGDFVLLTRSFAVMAKNGGEPKVQKIPEGQGSRQPILLLDAFEQEPSMWRKDYKVDMERKKGLIFVRLIAKKESTQPREIQVYLNSKTYNTVSLGLWFPDMGLEYRFSSIRRNAVLSGKLFEWKNKP